MGVNASAVVGKVRQTAQIANELPRLLVDGEKAKELALKLEEELLGDDDEVEDGVDVDVVGEDVKPTEEEKEKKGKEQTTPGLRERGSVFVQEKIEELLEIGDMLGELSDEQQVRKVSIWVHPDGHSLIHVGQDYSRPMVELPSTRSIDVLLLRRIDGIPGRTASKVHLSHATSSLDHVFRGKRGSHQRRRSG